MIKKYNQFLKESKEELDLQEAINEVLDWSPSYSDLCKMGEDPDIRFNQIQSEIEKYGWTLERIRKDHSDVELISLYRLMDSVNGYVDLYFYKLFEKLGIDKNIVELGGSGWSDIYVTEDEAFIRYSYGYHNTKYGMLLIDQLNGGLEEFTNQALSYLKEYILNDVPQNILSIYDGVGGFSKLTGRSSWDAREVIKMHDYVIIEEDRVLIFTKEISDNLNQMVDKNNNRLSETLNVTPDIIASNITNFLSNLGLDIDFTGNELMIWSKFSE
jgi:hypothetical protein